MIFFEVTLFQAQVSFCCVGIFTSDKKEQQRAAREREAEQRALAKEARDNKEVCHVFSDYVTKFYNTEGCILN